jgi:hypothetical protein
MAVTYTFEFPCLDTLPELDGRSDVVSIVHWRLKGTDDVAPPIVVERYGMIVVPTPTPESTFVAFDTLTPATVEEWVVAAFGAAQLDSLKAVIASEIADKRNPPIVAKAPPWVAA